MLILTRREGEIIVIGEDIQIEVVGIKGGHVKLGIEAPKKVPVHREEVFSKLRQVILPKKATERT